MSNIGNKGKDLLVKVKLAKTAGFCFGVQRAVDTVYTQIEEGTSPIYTYGPIVHNENVVQELEEKGLLLSALTAWESIFMIFWRRKASAW